MSGLLSTERKAQWDADAWRVVPDLISAGQVAAALESVQRYLPTPAEMLELGRTSAGQGQVLSPP